MRYRHKKGALITVVLSFLIITSLLVASANFSNLNMSSSKASELSNKLNEYNPFARLKNRYPMFSVKKDSNRSDSKTHRVMLKLLNLRNKNTVNEAVSSDNVNLDTDIVVYGGGASGVMAAYQAAVLGDNVILIEPTDWLGGQASAGGVGAFDSGLGSIDFEIGANPRLIDFIKQIYREHGLPDNQVYAQCLWGADGPPYGHFCVDTYIAKEAFKRLVSAPETHNRIYVLYRTDIFDDNPLLKQNGQVIGIRVKDFKQEKLYTIHSKVVIDASEYGDLIPYSGAAFTFRWGPWFHNREDALTWARIHDKTTESRIQDITFVADMRLVNSDLPASIRALYTDKIADKYPEFYPSGELLNNLKQKIGTGTKRDACVSSADVINIHPWGFYFHARYRALGDRFIPYTKLGYATCYDSQGRAMKVKNVSKYDVNYTNDFTVYGLFLLDRNIRKQEICKAKRLTLQNIAYLEKLPLPDGEVNKWYLVRENHTCDDPNCYILKESNCPDIPDDLEKNMYLIPYVRESFRTAGLINVDTNNPVLHWNQIVRFDFEVSNPFKALKPDSVSIAGYGFDLHDKTDDVREVVKDPRFYRSGPFQLPLGVFIPTDGQKESPRVVKGFLVAEKNIAVDRYIAGAIRVHPYVMLTGQVSGVLAHLAVEYNGDTNKIKVVEVQNLITSDKVKGKMSPYFYQDIDYTRYSDEYRYSELMSNLGLMIGDGSHNFRSNWHPHDYTSRYQIAIILDHLAQRLGLNWNSLKIRDYRGNFKDIGGSYAEESIKHLYEAGVTQGCSSTAFCGTQNTTLNQEVIFLDKLLRNKTKNMQSEIYCNQILLPETIDADVRAYYLDLIRAGLLKVKKQGQSCKVEYLDEKCGNDYDNCTVPLQPITRVDTGRLIWDIYYQLNR